MAFTKSHFERVARALNTEYRLAHTEDARGTIRDVAERLSGIYATENGRFDSRKFMSWVTDTSER